MTIVTRATGGQLIDRGRSQIVVLLFVRVLLMFVDGACSI